MNTWLKSLVLLFGLLGFGVLHAADTPANALLVLSKRDHTLAIVDPSSLKVIAKVPVGNDPHEVIASTDGKTAYISNYGFGAYNTLAVVDLVAQKALPAIDLGVCAGRTVSHSSAARPGSRQRPPRRLAATIRPPRRSIG